MGKTKKVTNATVQSNRFIVNSVLPVKDNEKYMLYGEIDEFTAIEINSIKQNLIEQDERYIKELKTFQNFYLYHQNS